MIWSDPIDIETDSPVKMHIQAFKWEPLTIRVAPSLSKKGWGNGYVRLPEGHKYYGVHYAKIPYPAPGGLTYSDKEVWADGTFWVIGFDTMHSWNGPHHDEFYVRFETNILYQEAKKDMPLNKKEK